MVWIKFVFLGTSINFNSNILILNSAPSLLPHFKSRSLNVILQAFSIKFWVEVHWMRTTRSLVVVENRFSVWVVYWVERLKDPSVGNSQHAMPQFVWNLTKASDHARSVSLPIQHPADNTLRRNMHLYIASDEHMTLPIFKGLQKGYLFRHSDKTFCRYRKCIWWL